MKSSYLTSAQNASQLPAYSLPEIAFIGRSNSGKSSLLNSLMGRKSLARTSARPGSTQMVNFFQLELSASAQMIFADLPGYGFQSAGGKVTQHWQELMDAYFLRPNLAVFLCLCDVRRDWEEFELAFMRRLSAQVPLSIVLTKIDKVNAKDLAKRKTAISKVLTGKKIAVDALYFISNSTGKGVGELQDRVLSLGQQF